MRRLPSVIGSLLVIAPLLGGAQVAPAKSTQPARTAASVSARAPGMEAHTYSLQLLSGDDAARLLMPYVPFDGGGGLFAASSAGGVRAITVVGNTRTHAVVDSVLKEMDHSPATIVFHFMLIAATDSVVNDASIGEVDGELRRLLRFNGYRRVSEATAMVAEANRFRSTMSSPELGDFTVEGSTRYVRGGRVSLEISLESGTGTPTIVGGGIVQMPKPLLSTSLSIPLGQTVVLGTAAGDKGVAALILTLRLELAK